MTTEVKNRPLNVEEELRAINRSQIRENVGRASSMLVAMGIFELIFGVAAIAVSSLAGAVFAVLTGAALIVSGVLEFVSAFARNNLARFIWGLVSIAAGAVVVAEPQAGLNVLGAVIGIYLLATGIARLFSANNRLWSRIGGAVGIILGIVILGRLSAVSAPLIGWLVGINIIINGILTIGAGNTLKRIAA